MCQETKKTSETCKTNRAAKGCLRQKKRKLEGGRDQKTHAKMMREKGAWTGRKTVTEETRSRRETVYFGYQEDQPRGGTGGPT